MFNLDETQPRQVSYHYLSKPQHHVATVTLSAIDAGPILRKISPFEIFEIPWYGIVTTIEDNRKFFVCVSMLRCYWKKNEGCGWMTSQSLMSLKGCSKSHACRNDRIVWIILHSPLLPVSNSLSRMPRIQDSKFWFRQTAFSYCLHFCVYELFYYLILFYLECSSVKSVSPTVSRLRVTSCHKAYLTKVL